jgi:hypothetical protein
MRTLLLVPAIGLAAALMASPPAASQDQSEWADLLGHDLKDWTRMGTGENPWRLTTDHSLICLPASDAYVPDDEFWDGTLKFEYRFHPTGEKTGYKASVSVRRSLNSDGCKLALGDGCGTITGTFQGSSDKPKEVETKPAEELARPIGEWNQVKVQMQGRSVMFFINGKPAGSFDRCDHSHGLVFFEVDGSEIEFRRIWWQETKETK